MNPYQLEMVGVRLEIPVLTDFATTTHDDWDSQEAQLDTAARSDLYRATEHKLSRLVAWAEQLDWRVGELATVAGHDAGYPAIREHAAGVALAAQAILDGLRLPSSAETEPGTARRLATTDLERATGALQDAAVAATDELPALTPYQLEVIKMRLEVSGMTHQAVAVSEAWDTGETSYSRTEWELGNLTSRVEALAQGMAAVEVPEDRLASYDAVEQACTALEAAADGILAGLKLPRSAEDVPGTMRAQFLGEFAAAAETFDRAAAQALGIPAADWQLLPTIPAPQTEMTDAAPPMLTATSPPRGSMTAARQITISGAAEIGAFVAANGRAADVGDSGAWSVEVALAPGINTIQITATDKSGNATTISHEIRRGYLLRHDGIGPARGGDPPDQVVAQFTSIFGTPSYDHVDTNPGPLAGGFATHAYDRLVLWRDDGLSLVFTDGGYFRSDTEPGLVAWYSSNPIFVTPEGIHIGSDHGELAAAYGSRLSVQLHGECDPAGSFYVRVDGPGSISGRLSGPPFDAEAIVIRLHGGFNSTC